MSQKTILLIAGYPNSLLNFRGPLLRALLDKGLEVHVAAPDLPVKSKVRHELEDMGVIVHEVFLIRTSLNPLKDIVTLIQLYRLMSKIKPQFSFGYTIKPVIYGTLAAWFTGVPYRFALITGLGYSFQGMSGQRSFLKKIVLNFYRLAIGKANKVFFQNPDDEALFQSLDIIKPSDQKTVVINGSGIDLSLFSVAPLPRTTEFLLIARLLGDKGIREYVKAATLVRQHYHDVRFGLVGWIDENPDAIDENELQQWIESGDVQFYGHLDDVKPAIASCSVYVLPSYREGTPRTVLEAMAMGRPIITTDAPGCRETVVDGDNGFLVPVKAIDELVVAMLKFVEQPGLVSRMGERSRLIAEEKYDVNKVNEHMLMEMGLK